MKADSFMICPEPMDIPSEVKNVMDNKIGAQKVEPPW